MSLGPKNNAVLGEVVNLHGEFIFANTVHQMKEHPHERRSARKLRHDVAADKTE